MGFKDLTNKYLGSHSWFLVNRFRTSLVSKAITGFSLSVFLLSSFPAIVDLTNSDWRLSSILIGSALFLCGYIYAEMRVPREINNACTLEDAVRSMWTVKHAKIMKSRLELLEKLQSRLSEDRPHCVSEVLLNSTKRSIDSYKGAGENVSENDEKDLIFSDFLLRQYDLEGARMISIALLGSGLILLLIPTAFSLFVLLFT